MGKSGNVVPTIVKAEHIGPDDTGDNIEAKRVANYVWDGAAWQRMSSSSAGDGAILDGVSSSIKATVFDYANSNPLGVVLRDTNGDYVSVGGGTQYTQDAALTVATTVGTISMGRASAAVPTDVSADNDAVIPWYLRSGAQATVLTAAGALIGGDAANGLDVDVTRLSALVAGSAIIGKVGIDQTTPGTTNLVALTAETTKVIGVVRTSDGAGNLLTSNSTTYTAKFGLDSNLLGTLGTAFSTAGKVDVKGADGDVFVRQATGTNLHAVLDSGTLTTLTTLTGTTTLTPGTGATNLGKAEDAAHSSGDSGVYTFGTRQDTPASTSGTSGDYQGAAYAAEGGQWSTLTPSTVGGWTTYHLASAGSTNATNIKASAGQVGGWYIYNSNAAARKVVFHNTAGTPTAGASVYFAIVIPPSAAANVEFTNGIPFATGIAITTVTGLADNDGTAVAANDLILNIWYK